MSAPLNRPSRKIIYEGFLEALKQAGIEDGEDFVQIAAEEKEKTTAFTDLQMNTPSLTTIKQPKYEMGKLAFKLLLKK